MKKVNKTNNIVGNLFNVNRTGDTITGAGASYAVSSLTPIRDFYFLFNEICYANDLSTDDVFNAFITAFITGDLAIKPSILYSVPVECRDPRTNPHTFMAKIIDRSGNVINPSPLTEEHIDIYQGLFYDPKEWRHEGKRNTNPAMNAPTAGFLKKPNKF